MEADQVLTKLKMSAEKDIKEVGSLGVNGGGERDGGT